MLSQYGRLAVIAFVSLFLGGCATFFEPGSVHQRTGKVSDLLFEPTLDLGQWHYGMGGPLSRWRDYYDVDGHGIFDVPVVATEQLFFTPVMAVCLPYVTLAKLQAGYHSPRGERTLVQRFLESDFVRYPWIAYSAATPHLSGPPLLVGLAAVIIYDPVVHDVPVILIGKPYTLLRKALQPNRQQEERGQGTGVLKQ